MRPRIALESRFFDRLFEVSRQRSFETPPFTCARMLKTQLPCVQHLAGKIFGELGRVDFVTQDRIAKMMQVHPNLMCTAAVQSAFNQTGLLARTKNSILSFGRATTG